MWAGIVAFFSKAGLLLKYTKEILAFFSFLKGAVSALKDLILKSKQKKQTEAIDQAETKLDEANKIDDEAERLRKKAEAACDLEKAINPDSDCR